MSDRSSVHHRCSHGFTLLELLIAIFILGIVLTTIYAAYSGTLTVIKELMTTPALIKWRVLPWTE